MPGKKVINILKNIAFLIAGILIMWLVYRDMPLSKLKEDISGFQYGWLALSMVFSILSNVSRAIRWNMLFQPLGYHANTLNAYLSIQFMYLVNLAVPRAGEVARCSVLTKYDKIPFSEAVGTVIIERIVDALGLMLIAFIVLISQLGLFKELVIQNPDIQNNLNSLFSAKLLVIFIIGVVVAGLFILLLRKKVKSSRLVQKLRDILLNVWKGIKAIRKVKNIWAFIGHTLFIYTMWLLMLYAFFLGYGPTRDLNIFNAMTVFVMSGLAMIAPVQGGIGPWHYMVSITLLIYGVNAMDAKSFAFIAHTGSNLMLVLLGLISMILLPVINRKREGKISAPIGV